MRPSQLQGKRALRVPAGSKRSAVTTSRASRSPSTVPRPKWSSRGTACGVLAAACHSAARSAPVLNGAQHRQRTGTAQGIAAKVHVVRPAIARVHLGRGEGEG